MEPFEDVYIAELMVESNVTLESNTILSAFNLTTAVSNSTTSHKVTLSHSELIAECLIVGDESTCNCSTGYIWSNLVCYEYNCCRETPCAQNVSQITPLCVAKVKVHINGSVTLNTDNWNDINNTKLKTEFEDLNGFEYLNITGPRLDNNKVVDFEAAVSVKFPTSKLQTIISNLESHFGAVLKVDTIGLVTIEAPETPVCYKSVPVLKCTFEERTGSAGWSLNKKYQRFELNTGSVVNLDSNCATPQYNSCIIVTLQKVTGLWSGLYECGFTSGSVRHTAKAQLNVTLLPDTIAMTINPLSADCSGLDMVPVTVNATISKTPESFDVLWHYMGKRENNQNMKLVGDDQVYTFTADVKCDNKTKQHVSVSFKNIKDQTKSAEVYIPVVHDGTTFCKEDDPWPKSPAGDTMISSTCEAGRVGYKSRTCEVTGNWQDVFFYCINEELNKVSNAADNFLKGLGATQEMAKNIFTGLKNISTSESYSSDSIADVIASINILDVMARASENITLQADILPDFISAASNMLDKSWEAVNKSVVQKMSSNYLQSVESLVKNIKIGSKASNASNTSNIFSPNLQLKFCSSSNCNVSVFGIGVNLNKTTGILKAVAIKNLTNNLRNDFLDTLPTSLLISATLENNSDSFLEIKLEFPEKTLNDNTKPYCVFWNTSEKDWSDLGCFVKPSNGNRSGQVVCECNHLTSFSVLMAKGDISNDVLDIITYVGLGVSIFSLLIFLTVESLVWSAVVKSNLSHFRHTAMVNIATFLLLADCSFLASTGGVSETLCLVLTVCKHLFFLAMFSWMLCMSVMLVHQLIFVFSPLRKRVFMFLSSIIGYVCPILIVGSSYVYCKYTNKQYYDNKSCWLVYERLLEGSIHAFILPVGTVILTNLFSMVVVITTLVKSSAPDASKVDDKETAKSIIKVVVFLTPVFGVTWIIGFAQLLLEKDDPMATVASYSFTILNSFQGLFLLLTGCFAEQKVREEMLKLIMAKSNGKSESMKNLTSTTYTKDK
ncbi:adhesion G-protein coupled receptor F3 [Cebidichthys violaceus]|uniref:adhesion G-protein coupled receptor F3 n=1 Tax=Cebidichthys violaceus TaxID=271503 RepID=UPI0035CA6D8E